MILTIPFDNTVEIDKDGTKEKVTIPGNLVMERIGAQIAVAITHPRITADFYVKEKKNIPIVPVNALIDTGASFSIITKEIADKLDLVHTGYIRVTSVQDEQDRPVYYGHIRFAWGMGKEIPLVCCPLKRFQCIIGRDILKHWNLIYNGVGGYIIIND